MEIQIEQKTYLESKTMAGIDNELAEAGYRMLGNYESKEKLILDILNKGGVRYFKAIPFLMYKYEIDADKIYSKTGKKKIFAQLIAITRRIFDEEGIIRKLPDIDAKIGFDYDDFKQEFDMQKLSSERPMLMLEKQKIYAERDLNMWLSKLFTKKEKYIFKRILEDKPVSRTDYEYYSRKTRKKLNAIINLDEFARTLASKTPSYDNDLFRLKKLLEKHLEKQNSHKDVLIKSFAYKDNTISINSRQKGSDEPIITLKNIGAFSKEIKDLLEKYKGKEQEFE